MRESHVLRAMTEAEFQQQVIDLARLTGWRVAHFRSVRQVRRDGAVFYSTPVQADGAGFLDLLMLRNGYGIVAELKVGRNKLSDDQKAWISEWEQTDFDVRVWRPEDWDEIVEALT